MPHTSPAIRPFSSDPDDDFEIRTALGRSTGGAGDVGEILAATAHVHPNDHEAWFAAWHRLGERTLAIAETAASADHLVSAAEAYLRAAAYLATAVDVASSLDDDPRLDAVFARQQEAWLGFVRHTEANVETVQIPYEDDALPGLFVRASSGEVVAPTLVAVNGSDGSLAALWAACVAPALRRGYNVLVFDGPGQQTQLFDRKKLFRPDWEAVLTPVYDFLAGISGVDPSRIALYGISQGGYWVARALAFEHRYAAAVVDPGIVDVSTSWTDHLPRSLLKLIAEGEIEKFDREMAFALRFSPETARTWRFRARPYGTSGYGETIETVGAYTVAGVATRISTALLVLSPEGEQFWPGQAERLASLTADVSTLMRFTAAEGADGHCQPLARSLTAQRMFDWLDERLMAAAAPVAGA